MLLNFIHLTFTFLKCIKLHWLVCKCLLVSGSRGRCSDRSLGRCRLQRISSHRSLWISSVSIVLINMLLQCTINIIFSMLSHLKQNQSTVMQSELRSMTVCKFLFSQWRGTAHTKCTWREGNVQYHSLCVHDFYMNTEYVLLWWVLHTHCKYKITKGHLLNRKRSSWLTDIFVREIILTFRYSMLLVYKHV